MAIVRIDPFREIAVLHDRMNRLFGNTYQRDEALASHGTWLPPVDIYETEERDLVLKAELPDMKREDIEVSVENSVLTIRGEKKLPADVKEDRYRRVERSYGSFNRSFTLPNTVDAAKVGAEYRNGVLTVKLPFREEAKPRTINVDVAA
jgi:HSP20 family protein